MIIEDIDLGMIYRSPNARPVEKQELENLSKSMAEVGLINPISVKRALHHRAGSVVDAYDIIAGNHRYEAAKRLKWQTIKCIVVDLDDLHTELLEIDENLIRANLTPAQEASAIARRKAIYEELHPETKAEAFKGNQHTGSRQIGDDHANRFTKETSAATGKSERNIQRAAARGEKLGDDLKEIEGTSLDKGVEIDALAKMDEQDRRELIERAKAGENVSARKEKIELQPSREEQTISRENIQYDALVSAWNEADDKPRKWFLAHIGAEI